MEKLNGTYLIDSPNVDAEIQVEGNMITIGNYSVEIWKDRNSYNNELTLNVKYTGSWSNSAISVSPDGFNDGIWIGVREMIKA
jgi:hypothetical protein